MIPVHALHDITCDQRITGPEFDTKVAQRAAAIAPYLSAERRCVFIAHGGSIAFFIDLFATWAAGACAVCLNTGLTQVELQRLIDVVGPAVILGSQAHTRVTVPILGPHDNSTQTQAKMMDWGLDDPALILFTSGTTGTPKGVSLSRRAILARLALNTAHIGVDTLAKTMNVLPTHFGHGLIGNCLTPLSAGGTLYLNPSAGVATAAGIGAALDAHGITFLSSVPGFWKLALRVSAPPTSGQLKRISVGSAPLSPELWRAIQDWSGADVWNMYGLTETANWVGGTNTPATGALGQLWGGQAAVQSTSGAISNTGTGELVLRVPSLMTGYHNQPDLSRDALSGGWYHTGDMGRIDADGLHLLGRKRYMVNIDGMKIYPEEIDALFERHPDIVEACAFAQSDPVSGERLALAIASPKPLDPSAVIDWARDKLRREALPHQVFVIADIPKTDRGKVNRDLVRDHVQKGHTL
ncbi:MAG: class I adenylate-forming enzyme family protein [Paracoccaceae bacterium]